MTSVTELALPMKLLAASKKQVRSTEGEGNSAHGVAAGDRYRFTSEANCRRRAGGRRPSGRFVFELSVLPYQGREELCPLRGARCCGTRRSPARGMANCLRDR